MENNKPLVILSILKWYAIVFSTLTGAILFVELVSVGDSVGFVAFILWVPVPVYLLTLVSRKLT